MYSAFEEVREKKTETSRGCGVYAWKRVVGAVCCIHYIVYHGALCGHLKRDWSRPFELQTHGKYSSPTSISKIQEFKLDLQATRIDTKFGTLFLF